MLLTHSFSSPANETKLTSLSTAHCQLCDTALQTIGKHHADDCQNGDDLWKLPNLDQIGVLRFCATDRCQMLLCHLPSKVTEHADSHACLDGGGARYHANCLASLTDDPCGYCSAYIRKVFSVWEKICSVDHTTLVNETHCAKLMIPGPARRNKPPNSTCLTPDRARGAPHA